MVNITPVQKGKGGAGSKKNACFRFVSKKKLYLCTEFLSIPKRRGMFFEGTHIWKER